jgi:hypothetical protein
MDSILPADANALPLLAWSHTPHIARACAPVLIGVVFDCRTDRLQRCCGAHRAHLEIRAPDAPRYIDSTAPQRSGCRSFSQSPADRSSTLGSDNRNSARPERRKHAVEDCKSDCAWGTPTGSWSPVSPAMGYQRASWGTDGYPAAANQCCQCSIAAKPFVARWRKARKYRVSPIFRRNLNRCF